MSTIFRVLTVMSWSATIAVMFGGALRLGPSVLRQIVQRPALFIRTLLAVWIAVPALTTLIVLGLRVEGISATVMLLMAGCPGIPLLLASTSTVKGAMNTAFVALVLTAATEPLLIPQWTRILSRFLPVDLTVQPIHILQVLVPTVFAPIAIGFIVRAVVSPGRSQALARLADWVYAIGVIGCILNSGAAALPIASRIPLWSIFAAVLITVGDAVIGYWAGWPDHDDQKAIALAAALGNPALALAVAEVSYPDHRAAPLIAAYLLFHGAAVLLVEWCLKRVAARRSRLRRASVH